MIIEPKIILNGNNAVAFVSSGYDLLNDVIAEMEFNGLSEYGESRPLPNGGTVSADVAGGVHTIEISIPEPPPEKIGVVEEEEILPELYFYVECEFWYVHGAIWESVRRCSVFDIKNQIVAGNVPKNGGGFAVFPCGSSEISDWLNYYITDPTLVPPLDKNPLINSTPCIGGEWEGSLFGEGCSINEERTHDCNRIKSCRDVAGQLQTFTDHSHGACNVSYVVEPGYNAGHTTCCNYNSKCLGIEGTHSVLSSQYLDYNISFAHGDSGIGTTLKYQYDFWLDNKSVTFDLEFLHRDDIFSSVFTSSDVILEQLDENSEISRTWSITGRCTPPGGWGAYYDKYRITAGAYSKSQDYSQGVKNTLWHTPLGNKNILDYGIDYTYQFSMENDSGPVNTYITPTSANVSGNKISNMLRYLAWPPNPGGFLWPTGNAYEGGNCYFTSDYLPEYTTISHMYGLPMFATYYDRYSAILVDPLGAGFDQWYWDEVESSQTLHDASFFSAMDFPLFNGGALEDELSKFDPLSMSRNSNLEGFINDLANSTILAAPWGDIFNSSYIRSSITPNITFSNIEMIPYPFKKKPD